MKKFFLVTIAVLAMSFLSACVPSGHMCDICSQRKATHEYENMLGGKNYVCGNCYKEVKELSE